MNVIFIGHADTETLDLPDMDPFARYTVRMHKKSHPALHRQRRSGAD
jgi:hypothetical protein